MPLRSNSACFEERGILSDSFSDSFSDSYGDFRGSTGIELLSESVAC